MLSIGRSVSHELGVRSAIGRFDSPAWFCILCMFDIMYMYDNKANLNLNLNMNTTLREISVQFPNLAYIQNTICLTHWGRVTHICVSNLAIIGSDNGLSPGRRQAIIWTNAGILLIGPLGTNFSETLIRIQTFSFKKMHSKPLENSGHFFSASMC